MTAHEIVRDIMQHYGFPRNTRSWQDYENAKQLVFNYYTGKRYDEVIQAIADWVGV